MSDDLNLVPDKLEIVPIDWARAFNSVAPLVTEARAYLQCGKAELASECLDRAVRNIRMCSRTMVMASGDDGEGESGPKSFVACGFKAESRTGGSNVAIGEEV